MDIGLMAATKPQAADPEPAGALMGAGHDFKHATGKYPDPTAYRPGQPNNLYDSSAGSGAANALL